MEMIVCECPHCDSEAETAYDDEYEELVPADPEWVNVEGKWMCPDCGDYTLDEDGDPICACEIPDDLEFGPVYQDARGHYSLARDSEGRLWRLDYGNPKAPLPYLWEDDEEEEP